MSSPTAEQVALQGLLLILAEVQNQVRAGRIGTPSIIAAKFGSFDQIEQLVEGAHAAEMVQLARAALAARNPRPDCTCPVNGVSSTCPAHGDADHRRVPAAAAATHA